MRDLESEENLEKNFEDFNTNRSGDFIFFEIYFTFALLLHYKIEKK